MNVSPLLNPPVFLPKGRDCLSLYVLISEVFPGINQMVTPCQYLPLRLNLNLTLTLNPKSDLFPHGGISADSNL